MGMNIIKIALLSAASIFQMCAGLFIMVLCVSDLMIDGRFGLWDGRIDLWNGLMATLCAALLGGGGIFSSIVFAQLAWRRNKNKPRR